MGGDGCNGNGTGNEARTEQALSASELSYRRLFEAAKDGILILDVDTGRITDANPFVCRLLGFSHGEMVGQTVGELSPFKDFVCNQAVLERLQQDGYVRYEDLPLETKDGRKIAVEFVSNIYEAGDKKVIQCNIRDITERKKWEQELERKNAELVARNEELLLSKQQLSLRSTALETTSNAVVITDAKGIILWVNPAFTTLTGYSAGEVIGKTPSLLKSGKHDREFYKNLWKTILAGKTWRGIFTNRRKDGSLYSDEHTITPVRCDGGEITHFVAIMNDMTERHRAEQELLESEVKFRTLFDTANEAAFMVHDGVFVDCNASGLKLFGVTRDQIIGQSPDHFSPPIQPDGRSSRKKSMEVIQRALAGEPQFFEWLHQRPDGTPVYTEISLNRLEVGGKACIQALARDTTERRRMEVALRESEVKFRALFDTASDAIFMFHNDIFVDCNANGLKLFGVTRDQLIGRSPVQFSPLTQPDGSNSQEKSRVIHQRALTGEPQFFEWVQQKPDGTPVYVEVSLSRFELRGEPYLQAIARDITERKQAELALAESQSRYGSLVENMLGGYAYCRMLAEQERARDFVYLDVNGSFETLTGLKDVVGKKASELMPGVQETNPELFEIYGRVALTGKPEKFETHVKPLGKWFSISVYSHERDHFTAIFEDITERKHAEEQLFFKTAFLEAQVNSPHDGKLIVDHEGKVVLQNQRMADLWNIPSEISNDPDDRRRLKWVSDQVKNSRQFAEKITYLYAHPDEVSQDEVELIDGRIFDRYSAPVRGKEGKYYGRMWTFRDITERKRAEAQIVEQAAFLDEARDAIIVRDLEGKILYWNKGAERVYGWKRQEALGRNILEILHFNPKRLGKINELTIKKGEWHGELDHLTKDRREITIESRCTLIRDDEGNPKSILSINADITEKKRLEAQAMRAQRMESIGTLAGGVAHDLNNILSPILMSIDILRSDSDNAETTQILETIKVSAKRGADIVRQVLSFARGLEGERIEVQPAHVLRELENMIKHTFPKDIRLQFSISNDIWSILGDPTQVHQVLLNLCVNARDAMPNGGNLTIGVENCVLDEQYVAMNPQAKAGCYVNISVTDSGTGMSADLLDKIFEPFFTTKELHKGTGLGLSTVMAIVKSHEGLISVCSELGKGTTFNVYLPAMELPAEARKALSGRVSLPRGKGETILVIDDEASILTITSQTLQAFGYHVLTATDGADAVAVYTEHKNEIAVVVTDMMMPLMDGTATIHALTRINPAIKIVAVSGVNSNFDASKVTGVKHFLTKPYTAGTLLKTLRAIMDEANGA